MDWGKFRATPLMARLAAWDKKSAARLVLETAAPQENQFVVALCAVAAWLAVAPDA